MKLLTVILFSLVLLYIYGEDLKDVIILKCTIHYRQCDALLTIIIISIFSLHVAAKPWHNSSSCISLTSSIPSESGTTYNNLCT